MPQWLFHLWRDVYFNTFVSSVLVPMKLRWRLLHLAGAQVGPSRIAPRGRYGSANISIGEGTFINYGVRFNTLGSVTLGERCDIGMDVSFVTQTHELGGPQRRAGRAYAEPITVGAGVWIGANATILPGVTIGSGAVVAAGAVVVGDCAANTLYAGVPARAIRVLS